MNKHLFYDRSGLKDPFKISRKILPKKVLGWYGDHKFFREIITENVIRGKDSLNILEIGSFVGQSAINMASCLRDMGSNSVIFCVDTWLGSEEHWKYDSKAYNMELFGYFEKDISALYNQFISNVIHEGVEGYIIPIPNTSSTAASLFKFWNIDFNLIYVDGDHSERGVRNDMNDLFPLLKDGGTMFGDDWHWESVRNAVNSFHLKPTIHYDRFWSIKKC